MNFDDQISLYARGNGKKTMIDSTYANMTVKALKLTADDRGIEYRAKITKPELIDLHMAYDAARAPKPAKVTKKLEPLAMIMNYARANSGQRDLTLAQAMGVKLTVKQRRAIRRKKRLFDHAEKLGIQFKEVKLS